MAINTKLNQIRSNLEDLYIIAMDDNTIRNLLNSISELLDSIEADCEVIADKVYDNTWLYEEIERLQDQVCNSD